VVIRSGNYAIAVNGRTECKFLAFGSSHRGLGRGDFYEA